MVRVQSIVRALLVAIVAVGASGVYAEDAATQTKAVDTAVETTCVAPEVVVQFETKIEALEGERAKWESQLVAANGAWKKEKLELEERVAAEQAAAKKVTQQLKRAQQDADSNVDALEAKHTQTMQEVVMQVFTLEQKVEELKTALAEQKKTMGKRDAEVSAAKAKLLQSQDQVKVLERDVATSRRKNEALRIELEKMDEKLTISALLSSYYDEGVVLAGNAVSALREQVESAQQGTTGVTQALEALETYRKTAIDTTDKLYVEHLAATIDPIIADLRLASEPYVKQYQPLVEAEFARAKKTAIKNYNLALKRGKAARADAIALLRQTEGVAPYAQKIVDGSLYLLAAPLVFITVRIVLSLTWFIIRTILCILTFGFCCGRCAKKRSKLKRKASRKPVPAAAPTATPAAASVKKGSASPPSNGKRSTGGKKQK